MQLFDTIIADVPATVKALSDKELESDKTEKELIEHKKLESPELDLKNKTVDVKKETVTDKDIAEAFLLIRGQEAEVVTYTVPVLGDLFLFKEVFPKLSKSKDYGLMFHRSDLIYKRYSAAKVEGNDALLEEIKNRAHEEFDVVQQGLKQMDATIKEFNEKRLPEAVKAAFQKEKAEREALKKAEDKLKF